MAIGDDLQILLGMVPIRDRAGIARGTMADAAVAAANPHANGQELTRRASTSPARLRAAARPMTGPHNQPPADVQLPDDVNTEYTAGSGAACRRRSRPSSSRCRRPTDRARHRLLARCGAVPGGHTRLGHPDEGLRAAAAPAAHAGDHPVDRRDGQQPAGPARAWRRGGAAAGGPDLNTLKTIIDMRNAENQQAAALAIRKQTIEELQRSNGYSPEYGRRQVRQRRVQGRPQAGHHRQARGRQTSRDQPERLC
jgi:hypothetical protein